MHQESARVIGLRLFIRREHRAILGPDGADALIHAFMSLRPNDDADMQTISSLMCACLALHEMAHRDEASGLLNLRALLSNGIRLLRKPCEKDEVNFAFFLDDAHFKLVNDSGGFPFGTLVISRCGSAAQHACRQTSVEDRPRALDIVGRYFPDDAEEGDHLPYRPGGDEMVICGKTKDPARLLTKIDAAIREEIAAIWNEHPEKKRLFDEKLAMMGLAGPYANLHPRLGCCTTDGTTCQVWRIFDGRPELLATHTSPVPVASESEALTTPLWRFGLGYDAADRAFRAMIALAAEASESVKHDEKSGR